MIDIAIKDLVKYYGANKVLDGLSLELHQGERLGVVGANGSGKTTLLRVIAGEGHEGGQLMVRKGITVGYLQQIVSYSRGTTVRQVIRSAFAGLLDRQRQLEKLEAKMAGGDFCDKTLREYGALREQFEQLGGYQMEEKLGRVCRGLELEGDILARDVATLSGGQQTTVELARILLEQPDVLLLDEPSNHLDMEAVAWLEQHLAKYGGTVMVVSHDRWFLDQAVNRIVELDQGKAEVYHGNYSYYVEEKERRRQRQFQEWLVQQKKIKATEEAIARFRDWGARADNPKFFKKAASLEKRLEKMDKVGRPGKAHALALNFNTGATANDVFVVKNVAKALGGKAVLTDASLHIRRGEKVALLGDNGCGKTTLLNLLLGTLRPDRGEARVGSRVEVGWLAQAVRFDEEEATVLDSFRHACPMNEEQARNILARFLFRGDEVFHRVGKLSGGERSRLRLCQLMYGSANTLVLDEPTNHLDIPAREVLEQALNEFEGTVLFVSHDRWFINQVAGQVAELKEGQITRYPGDFQYYWRKREQQLEQGLPDSSAKPQQTETKQKKKGLNQWQLERLEAEIAQLEEQLAELEQEMEAAASDFEKLEQLTEQRNEVTRQLEQVWARLA